MGAVIYCVVGRHSARCAFARQSQPLAPWWCLYLSSTSLTSNALCVCPNAGRSASTRLRPRARGPPVSACTHPVWGNAAGGGGGDAGAALRTLSLLIALLVTIHWQQCPALGLLPPGSQSSRRVVCAQPLTVPCRHPATAPLLSPLRRRPRWRPWLRRRRPRWRWLRRPRRWRRLRPRRRRRWLRRRRRPRLLDSRAPHAGMQHGVCCG